MNSFLSAFLGAAVLAAGYLIFVAVRKTWALLDGVIKAAGEVPELIKALRSLLEVGRQIAGAVETLNSGLMSGYVPPNDNPPMHEAVRRRPMPAFPGAPPIQYEATEDETEIIETSDAELAELEKVDEVRGKGYSVEQDESIAVQPPGVTKDAVG